MTHTEVGWNFHDNVVVLGTPGELAAVKETIVDRWITAACAACVTATPGAQYVEYARDPAAVRVYVHKLWMHYAADASRGRTPGDLLRAYYAGDADAADAWADLEEFLASRPHGVLLTQRGKGFRRP